MPSSRTLCDTYVFLYHVLGNGYEFDDKRLAVDVIHHALSQTLLKMLEATCGTEHGLAPVSCCIACVTVADIVVKSCRSWTTWKSDVLRLGTGGAAAGMDRKRAVVVRCMRIAFGR